MSAFRLTAIAAILLFGAWFAVFGGEVFGPILDKLSHKVESDNYLTKCPFDEVRLQFYDVEGREIKMTLNLEARNLSSSNNELIGWGLFWTRKNPFTNTMTSALAAPPTPYTDSNLSELKSELAALPKQDTSGLELDRNEAYFAFCNGDKSRIYHCSKSIALTAHAHLIQMLGLSSL